MLILFMLQPYVLFVKYIFYIIWVLNIFFKQFIDIFTFNRC